MRSLRALGFSGRAGSSPEARVSAAAVVGLEQRVIATAQLGRELHDIVTTQLGHHGISAAAALDDTWRQDALPTEAAAPPEVPALPGPLEESAALPPVSNAADVVTPTTSDRFLAQPPLPAASVEAMMVTPPPSPSDFLLERVLDALDARVQLSAEEARVHVDIEGHGEVELTLCLQGNSISVAVQGAGSAALEARALELRAALAAQGIELERLEFRSGEGGGEQSAGRDTSSGRHDDTGSHDRQQAAREERAQDIEQLAARRTPRRGVHVKA
jgi:hypothetical protein